jgi:outer membrane lipoprotein-sorting protein
LSFYKKGYNFAWGNLKNESGRSVQYITLNPIDSKADIVEVQLAIDAKTKHIYKLIQKGANGSKTILTINSLKSNQAISDQLFSFDQAKYKKLKYTID